MAMGTEDRLNQLEQDVDMGVTGEQVPVHISPDEVVYLNILQDGQSVDQDTGLREYSKLSLVLQNPKVRELFITIVDLLGSGEPIPEDLKAILDTPSEDEEDGFEPIESDYDPRVQEMAEMGEGEDKILVMMPTDVVELLDSIQGGKHEDPTLGLQEFWSLGNVFKSVARVVATVGGGIGGFMIGGPAGAAAGAGLGNMVSRGATGQKFGGDMLRAGAMNGLMAYGAGHAAAAGWLGSGVAGMGAQTAGVGGAAGGAGLGATTAGKGALGAGLGRGAAGSALAAKTASTAAAPSMFSGLSSYALPAALLGGSLFLGQRGQKKQEEADRPMREKDEATIDEYNRRQLGKYDTPYEIESVSHEFDPRLYARKDHKRHYKKGGKVIGIEIKGKGTGQSDEIPRTVPENAWVWDATTVAHLGDGSTKAGHKAIDSFEKMIKRHKLPHVKEVIDRTIKEKPLRKVPCALSDGERVTLPHGVAAVGDGSFDKGAVILRKMTKELRKHKASKGLDLPPAAHDLTVYYKKALRGE